jgi:hypothetical protein
VLSIWEAVATVGQVEYDLIGVLGIGNSIALLQIQRVVRKLEDPSCFGAPSGSFGWLGGWVG